MTLMHMFNEARSPQLKLKMDNPAAHVPKPNPQNGQDYLQRRLDTNWVLLYKGKPIQQIITTFKSVCHRVGITNSVSGCSSGVKS